MEMVLKVNGMMCQHCKANVEKACMAVPGVMGAEADLKRKEVRISGNASYDDVAKTITDADFEVVGKA